MNVLVTSIGSMSGDFVVRELRKLGHFVIGIDIYPNTWVANSKDVDAFYTVPATLDDEKYLVRIKELCTSHRVEIIVPLTDIDVDFYANLCPTFSSMGVVVTISDPTTIALLRNKLAVHSFLNTHGLNAIPTYEVNEYASRYNRFPAIAKIINGRSSEGLIVIEHEHDMAIQRIRKNHYVLQPYLEGKVLVCDLLKDPQSGAIIWLTRRELTRTMNGAGITVEIVEEPRVAPFLQKICDVLDVRGCINIEFLETSEACYLMDVNPRFSAGVAFSHLAGYNFVKNHIATFIDKPIDKMGAIRKGMVITRKYVEVVV